MSNRLLNFLKKLVEPLIFNTSSQQTENANTLDWMEQWRREAEERRRKRAELREKNRLERLKRDRTYFGKAAWGSSLKQRQTDTDKEKLGRYELPLLTSEQELADWLEIPLSRLRWFTHDKPADTVWHYVRYTIPKRSGGERVILAPKAELKALQQKILHELLDKASQSEQAHGFVTGRSIVSNARPHVGKAYLLNLDLENFFPTITFPRVRGLFISLGYSFAVASTLALLCTAYERRPFTRTSALSAEGEQFYIAVGPRHLVQGAPTSPALSNLIARSLDRRLQGLAQKAGFAYTRYADDLTFSGDSREKALMIQHAAERIIAKEGFAVNQKKTKLYGRGQRQMVTGVVVNEQLSAPRQLRRQVRAILHNIGRSSVEAQNREDHPDFVAHLTGLIAHIYAINPQQGEKLLAQLEKI